MTQTPTYIDAAKAILAGKPVPTGHGWSRWAAQPRIATALAEMWRMPAVTIEDLAALYPDRQDDDPAEAEAVTRYNALSPVERAISEWADTLDVIRERNPIVHFELRLALRRALERMVAMGDTTFDPTFGGWQDDDGVEVDHE